MGRVSVLIPVYNGNAFIRRSLDSVLKQDYGDFEIIIIDDGSTDETFALVKEYLTDKRVKYFKTENNGVSHALNKGLEMARGDYVSLLHADDLFASGKLKEQVGFMDRNAAFGASYTAEKYFLEGTSLKTESPYAHFSGDVFYFLKRNNFIHASSIMFRKDILKGVRFDERLKCHEDWDLFLMLACRGERFLYIDEPLVSISIRPDQLSADNLVMDATRQEVGIRAKALWNEFKETINLYSASGLKSLLRYVGFKLKAVYIGFPKRKIFNMPPPQIILAEKRRANHEM